MERFPNICRQYKKLRHDLDNQSKTKTADCGLQTVESRTSRVGTGGKMQTVLSVICRLQTRGKIDPVSFRIFNCMNRVNIFSLERGLI